MRSKRQRKQRDNKSLRKPRTETRPHARPDLSAALLQPSHEENRQDGEAEENGTALVLPGRAKRAKNPASDPQNVESQLSKGEQRKKRRILEEKELKTQRKKVFETLAEHALPDTELALLRSSAALGQRETKRQRVARELTLQRAGLPLPKNAQLEQRRKLHLANRLEAHIGDVPAQDTHGVLGQRRSFQKLPEAGDTPSSSSEGSQANSAPQQSTQAVEQTLADPEALRQAVNAARVEMGLPTLESSAATIKPTPDGPSADQSEPSGKDRLVGVTRVAELQEARLRLPILGMEQEIMEAIHEHDVVVLAGETGCGKTTQVPQFLYEAGFGNSAYPERSGLIGVTQPRRVAAIASAQRIAAELNSSVGAAVGYQVRYDPSLGKSTAVKIMTDGILLREVQSDFLLQKYSCVIIDEAHERSLNTDLLIGMLSRIVPMRRKLAREGRGTPLKLVVMSATLRTEDFVENRRLFSRPPPLVTVPTRQFPVEVHFSRHTELHDYTGVVCSKVGQLHRQLPPGGILVFLTGQREIEDVCKRLRASLGRRKASAEPLARTDGSKIADEDAEIGVEEAFGNDAAEAAEDISVTEENFQDDYDQGALSEEEDKLLLGGEGFSAEELAAAEQRLQEQQGTDGAARKSASAREVEPAEAGPVHVLPLYAMLPQAIQACVFQDAPPGHRLIVVATNVAETSLTIPGIRYVVDAGRAKQKVLEPGTGVARYEVGWISKASAMQRSGRAGRIAPGHCYRLYSSAVFNDQFQQHSAPEILNTALEGVVLIMKAMGIEKVDNFPFPTPPSAAGLQEAQRCLAALGALRPSPPGLTAVGLRMAEFPLSPRHARVILYVAEDAQNGPEALELATLLAAAMSSETPFVQVDSLQSPEGDGEEGKKERQQARALQAQLRNPSSDALSALQALMAYQAAQNPAELCRTHRLHAKNLGEASALYKQLRRTVELKLQARLPSAAAFCKLTPHLALVLRKALVAGWADQVARRIRPAEQVREQQAAGKRRAVRYRCGVLEEEVFLHPKSALHAAAPDFVIYSQLVQTAKRPYMTGVTEIDAHLLVDAAAPLCSVSGPLDEPPPQYVPAKDAVVAWHAVTFSQRDWALPNVARPLADDSARARVFAAALLSGAVLPSMKALKASLALLPEMAAKVEAQGQPRVHRLISALLSYKIDSRAALGAAWRREGNLLKPEMAAWMRRGDLEVLIRIWPRLVKDSQKPRSQNNQAKEPKA